MARKFSFRHLSQFSEKEISYPQSAGAREKFYNLKFEKSFLKFSRFNEFFSESTEWN